MTSIGRLLWVSMLMLVLSVDHKCKHLYPDVWYDRRTMYYPIGVTLDYVRYMSWTVTAIWFTNISTRAFERIKSHVRPRPEEAPPSHDDPRTRQPREAPGTTAARNAIAPDALPPFPCHPHRHIPAPERCGRSLLSIQTGDHSHTTISGNSVYDYSGTCASHALPRGVLNRWDASEQQRL